LKGFPIVTQNKASLFLKTFLGKTTQKKRAIAICTRQHENKKS
jgi:hypothetical protein